jgi:hypothetical protein
MTLLCFSGSNDEAGLRQLAPIYVPKMEKTQRGAAGATLTLCRYSLYSPY